MVTVVDDEEPPTKLTAFQSARDKLARDELENRRGGMSSRGRGRGGPPPARGGFALPRGRGRDDEEDEMKPPPYYFAQPSAPAQADAGGRKVLGAKRPLSAPTAYVAPLSRACCLSCSWLLRVSQQCA